LFTLENYSQGAGLTRGKQYTIGEIKVTGTSNYNEQTVIAFTGLKEGEKIYIPGERLTKVLNKLWDLGLFSDINFYLTNVDGNVADLELEITEVPQLIDVKVRGIKKRKRSDIVKDNELKEGKKITENVKANIKSYVKNKYRKKGFLNANANIETQEVRDSTQNDKLVGVDMTININKGEKVKIKEINFDGNNKFSNWKLHRKMKKTKEKFFLRFWKRSKLIPEEYEADKQRIVDFMKAEGYRDARILSDTIRKLDENNIAIDIKVKEGDRYYFGDIEFLGNTVYSDERLKRLIGIRKGDPYNGPLLQEKIADNTKPDADDVTNLYQNSGYLFSQINPVETNVYNDTIDFEIRIQEGKVAYFDKISVEGNTRTNDNVVYRNLRTLPGRKYSKDAVVRSVRELGQVGYFDPESINPQIQNVNPQAGTLDVNYQVAEQGSSQIQLQGGYGGGGFIGTLGLSFNNFSMRNLFNKDAWKPIPMGDGQKLSLRAQASQTFRNYSFSFTEPWLGGKKPVRLSVSLSRTTQFLFNPLTRSADTDRNFSITGIDVGYAKRLQEPDNYFTFNAGVGFQHYNLNNYNVGLFRFPNGQSNNLSFQLGLTRDNTFVNPIYPLGGSKFNVSAKFTIPYSLFNNVDYDQLAEDREVALEEQDNAALADIDQQRFNWLEFYKVKFSGEWFNKIWDKLVLRSKIEYGFLGAYNQDRGVPPFERFFLGGDGLGGFTLDGREVIQLRGYPNQSIMPRSRGGASQSSFNDGATIYNKYTLELRYPITLKPSASIYALTFLEGGSSYDEFRNFSPFELSRSAGFGLRIFMPAFGLLGIDFGHGFDPIPGTDTGPNGWETHFIIGRQF
jgi:outer membrane protein insertion porin family